MDFRISCALLSAACFIALPMSANAQSTRGVPDLKVEANCKATQEIDKSLTEPQSYEACMRDEQTAQ